MIGHIRRRCLFIMIALLALIVGKHAYAAQLSQNLTEAQRVRCYDVLTGALEDKSTWVRVHAAEALVWLKHPEPALAAFRRDADTSRPQYRIVVWRVLAAAEPKQSEQRRYVERIRDILLDPNAPDQTHAMEAMAKLREPATTDVERKRVREIADAKGPASPFAVWRLAQEGDASAAERLVKLLSSDDATTRARAAYVLGRLQPISAATNDAIISALKKEPSDTPAHAMLRAALGHDEVCKLAADVTVAPTGRYFAAMRLAECGSPIDRAVLTPLLADPDPDVRVAAAYALLAIGAHSATTIPATPPG